MPKTTKDFLISQIEENFRCYFLNVDDSCTRAEYVFKIIKSFLDTENKRVRLLAEDVTVVLEKDLFIDTAYVYLDRQGERILVEGLSIYYPINEYRENKKFFKEGGEIQLSRPFMDQEAFDELESKFDETFSQGVADSWLYYSPDSYSALEDFLSAEEIKEMRSEFGFDAPAAQDEGDEDEDDKNERIFSEKYDKINEWLYDTDSYNEWWDYAFKDQIANAEIERLFLSDVKECMEDPLGEIEPYPTHDSYFNEHWQAKGGKLVSRSGKIPKRIENPLLDLMLYAQIEIDGRINHASITCTFPFIVEDYNLLLDFLGDDPRLDFNLKVECSHLRKYNQDSPDWTPSRLALGPMIDYLIQKSENRRFFEAVGLNRSSSFSLINVNFS